MGEGRASGAPWGAGRATGGWKAEGERFQTGLHTLRGVRHTFTARTSPTRPRAASWARRPNQTFLGAHGEMASTVLGFVARIAVFVV